MGSFGAAHGLGAKRTPSLKFVAYPTMVKLGNYSLPKEGSKNI